MRLQWYELGQYYLDVGGEAGIDILKNLAEA
jgi:hypothetical protein